jgi:hypothetical protein
LNYSSSFKDGSSSLTDPFHIAYKFNDLFSSIGTSLSKKIVDKDWSIWLYLRIWLSSFKVI